MRSAARILHQTAPGLARYRVVLDGGGTLCSTDDLAKAERVAATARPMPDQTPEERARVEAWAFERDRMISKHSSPWLDEQEEAASAKAARETGCRA